MGIIWAFLRGILGVLTMAHLTTGPTPWAEKGFLFRSDCRLTKRSCRFRVVAKTLRPKKVPLVRA